MRLTILFFLVSPLLSAVPCGTHLPKAQESNRVKRLIIGGNNVAAVGKWPWQVLVFAQNWNGEFSCGGTVISANWILTAGHCVRDRVNITDIYDMKVTDVFGTFTGLNRLEKPKRFNVIHAIPYPNYTHHARGLDIALLKLEKPLIFDDTISPICLPNPLQSIPSDGYAVAIGFGRSNYRGTKEIRDSDSQLREVILPIVDRDVCNQRWAEETVKQGTLKKKVLQHYETLQLICAGAMGHGVNTGDSGGPLMMKALDERWFQVGIASFISTKRGVEADVSPNGFTDIRPYCGWIETTTEGEASCEKEEVALKDVEIQM